MVLKESTSDKGSAYELNCIYKRITAVKEIYSDEGRKPPRSSYLHKQDKEQMS